jgi:hypothetical protein
MGSKSLDIFIEIVWWDSLLGQCPRENLRSQSVMTRSGSYFNIRKRIDISIC